MEFEVMNPNKYPKAYGGELQGYLSIDFDSIVDVFGKPYRDDGYKVDARWLIRFTTSTGLIMAKIYNFKTGKNYLGHQGKKIEDITWWHIGGRKGAVVACVERIFPKQCSPLRGPTRNLPWWDEDKPKKYVSYHIKIKKKPTKAEPTRLKRRMDG